jgi:hypothetical protein
VTIVLHRKRHPSNWRWWFVYRGRTFGVMHEGPGWGYSIVDDLTSSSITDNLFHLRDVREVAHAAVDAWWPSQLAYEAYKHRRCLACGADNKAEYVLCWPCSERIEVTEGIVQMEHPSIPDVAALTCCEGRRTHGHRGCVWPNGTNPSAACHHNCKECREHV